jgi:hypothetical protein
MIEPKIKVERPYNGPSGSSNPAQIKLSVALSDQSFDSSISLPVDSGHDERLAFVQAWLKLMEAAIELSKTGSALQDKR